MNRRKSAELPVNDSQPPETLSTTTAEAKPARRSSLGRKAGRALFWNIAFLPLKASLSILVPVVTAKIFASDLYAALAAVQAVIGTLGLYVDLGIERALPRFVNEIEKQQGRAALRLFITRITILKLAVLAIVVLGLTIGADIISRWLAWGEQGPIYLALIAVLLVLGAIYDISTQILYSFFKQKVTNLLDIVVTIINPLITLVLIGPFGLRVYGVVLALVITTVVSVFIAGWQAWLAARDRPVQNSNSNLQPPGQSSISKVQSSIRSRFIRYAALMYFFNISAWFYDAPFAVLVFTFYKELTTVALIKLIYNFIKSLLKNLLLPFVGVQTPLFSSIHGDEVDQSEKLQTAYASITKLQIFILVPSGIGAIILARNLLELLFVSDQPRAVLQPDLINPAAWATILTVVFTFAEALISVPMVILMVYERYRSVIFARTLPLLAGPLLIMVAVLHWDIVVAVTVMGLMAVGSRVIAMLSAQRIFGLYYPIQFLIKVLKATLAFGVPLGLLALLLPVNWPVTLSLAAAGVVIFYAVFKWLGGFDLEDKNRLQNLNMPLRKYIIKWL